MDVIRENFNLLWEAMFLQPLPYQVMRDKENPVAKGFVLLILLGIALALAGFISATFAWASGPSLAAVQETVLRNIQQMEWWRLAEQDPQFQQIWTQIWDSVWTFVQNLSPSPVSGLAGFVARPLGLIIGWLLFGSVAHLFAKLLGGSGEYGPTLGATALASAPELLGLVAVVPFVTLTGITIWTLLARYMAIRVAHDLSWGRAVWVVVLTFLVLFFVVFFLVSAGVIAFSTLMATAFAGG